MRKERLARGNLDDGTCQPYRSKRLALEMFIIEYPNRCILVYFWLHL